MKQNTFPFFLIKLFVLSAILYGILFIVFNRLIPIQGVPTELMLILFFIITALSHFIVIKAQEKKASTFVFSFMGTSTMRLIVYSSFILVYCYFHKEVAKPSILTFFLLYIVYTIFEVKTLQKHLKG